MQQAWRVSLLYCMVVSSLQVKLPEEERRAASTQTLKRINLDLLVYPLARCNDGSGGAYYFAPASSRGGAMARTDMWLVFLMGGGWCWDETSCASRYSTSPSLMSSKQFPEEREVDGILSADPTISPLATANKVYVPYCSSDAYVGDAQASDATYGWHFRGQELIRATLKEISRAHGLSKGHTLIFGGCSAGGRGAMFNLEYLPEFIPQGVKIAGFFDSPMWVDMEPLDAGAVSFQTQTAAVFKMTNAQSRMGTRCASIYTKESEQFKCLFGEYRAPTIDLPFLVAASQYDSFQIRSNTGVSPPYDADQLAYVERFRQRVQQAMMRLNVSHVASFAYSCYGHCISEGKTFWTQQVTIGGTKKSLYDVTSEWMRKQLEGEQVIDKCGGFDCGCSCNSSLLNDHGYQAVCKTGGGG
uniref:Pectin acetylesterase n=1 Tax=Guillardia theta TaxID=55529 RepID=A0A7S4H9U1_GUITH|mmetsp:Transcript_11579/g.39963  ORF Transcript_11579/g.39963 Transcript_11579/m.39963 type:complete len:414 (+) Transcript_11579:117-1358(+)